MSDISKKIDYTDRQSKFLSPEYDEKVWRMFCGKRIGGKLKIEIGLQELKLTVKQKKVKNGVEYMMLSFWKAPAQFDELKSKISYHTIDCYHILKPQRFRSFKDNWFRPFTTCLDEKSFAVIKKGQTFRCLVSQTEEKFEKWGETMTYEKGDRAGTDIVLVKPEIVKVLAPDEEIEIDYWQLYKFLDDESNDI